MLTNDDHDLARLADDGGPIHEDHDGDLVHLASHVPAADLAIEKLLADTRRFEAELAGNDILIGLNHLLARSQEARDFDPVEVDLDDNTERRWDTLGPDGYEPLDENGDYYR